MSLFEPWLTNEGRREIERRVGELKTYEQYDDPDTNKLTDELKRLLKHDAQEDR